MQILSNQHILLFIFCMAFNTTGLTHQTSHSQINLQQEGHVMTGAWHMGIDDLERSQGIDINGDNELSWGELLQQQHLIDSLAKAHFRVLQKGKACVLSTNNIMLDRLSTGLYLYLPISIQCPDEIKKLNIQYDFLLSFDAQHKAILNIQSDDTSHSVIFNQNSRVFKYDSTSSNKTQAFFDFIWQGIWHIWIGIDHILFLLSLLLTSALVLDRGTWYKQQSMRQTLLNTAKIITAFTLAHSITLAFSISGFITISSRIVESVIAASVIVAALNNIRPVVHKRLWILTFVFGLIHGLGFASVLNDVGLPADMEGLALLGFNIGVELGQLAIVATVLPLIYMISHLQLYRRIFIQAGSFLIAALGAVWFFEIAINVEIISWI